MTIQNTGSPLTGEKAHAFIDWLEEAKWYLPRSMMLDEARQIFERKLKDEEIIRNETNCKLS